MESDIKSRLESLLFVSGEPMSFGKLSKVMGEKENILKQAATELADDYKARQGGLRIIVDDGKAQMVTAGENAETIEKLMKIDIEGDLSRSALETVSIIAYRGPISRAEIEEIRGVNTSFTLRQLAIRGLVEKIDNPNDARSYLYKISFDFLRHLGIEKAEDLPRYAELREKELVSERIMKDGEGGEEFEGKTEEEKAADSEENKIKEI
jgi:segregation and condensation protein B